MEAFGQFEVNPDIVLMAAFAHTMRWWDRQADGGLVLREYVPPITLRRRDGSVAVVDVRTSEEAADPRWRRTSAFLENDYREDHRVEFSTLTELSIGVEPRRSNVARMLQSRMIVRDEASLARVRTVVHSHPLPSTIGEVAKRAALPNPHGRGDPAFACLVELAIAGEIALDMSEAFGPRTEVSRGILWSADAERPVT